MSDETNRRISRRDLLKGTGAAVVLPVLERAALIGASPGALSATPPFSSSSGESLLPEASPPSLSPSTSPPAFPPSIAELPRPRILENLSAAEGDLLEGIMARLIPDDEYGPGAIEAGALNYIDRALGGFLAGEREAYRAGLEAFDRYCRMSRGGPFLELSSYDKDSALIDCEIGSATGSGAGFPGTSTAFFNMVKGHIWQGVFGDPYYGGNANFIGWDLIHYPGVRTGVSAADQALLERGELPPVRRSAYDSGMFEPAVVRRNTGETEERSARNEQNPPADPGAAREPEVRLALAESGEPGAPRKGGERGGSW